MHILGNILQGDHMTLNVVFVVKIRKLKQERMCTKI